MESNYSTTTANASCRHPTQIKHENELSSDTASWITIVSQESERITIPQPHLNFRIKPSKTEVNKTQKSPRSKVQRTYSGLKYFVTDQWFLLTLGILVAISSQAQVPATAQTLKEIIVTYLCVAVIFFITGCTLPSRVLWENYTKWKIHLFVQVQCFLMCSALVYGVVSICATNTDFMDPALLIGLIFVGCVPTTIASNVFMTKQAHGDHVLTVVQSTIGNLIGPALSPVLINMYTAPQPWYTEFLPLAEDKNYAQVYKRVFKQFGLSLFLPLAIGQIVQNLFPAVTKRIFITWHLSKLGSFALLILIWQTFDQAFETGAFTDVKGNNMIFVVFISIAFYFSWTIICVLLSLPWLSREEVVAVAYCVPAKTPALGVPLSNVMFVGLSKITQSKIQLPVVIFQGLQIACGSLMTPLYRRWVESNEDTEKKKDVEKAPSAT